jgi:NTE family protein
MSVTKMSPITLALSGGGARCAAQAGVLAVLDQNAIRVGALSGVSGGGLVAVLYAAGLKPPQISQYIAETHLLDVWAPDPGRSGLFGTAKMRARLQQAVGDKTFADLAIPVVLIAADLSTGEEIQMTSGRLDDALLATMALPGMLPPQDWGGRMAADGGLLNPLPIDVCRRLGGPVVAVDVLGHAETETTEQLFEARGPMEYAARFGRRVGLTNTLEVVHQAALITSRRLRDARLATCPPDALVSPGVGRVGLFAFDLAPYAYEQGESAARAALSRIAALARPAFARRFRPGWRRADQWRSDS